MGLADQGVNPGRSSLSQTQPRGSALPFNILINRENDLEKLLLQHVPRTQGDAIIGSP
jgi:hypothetical protein